jgi:hypothetical protein
MYLHKLNIAHWAVLEKLIVAGFVAIFSSVCTYSVSLKPILYWPCRLRQRLRSALFALTSIGQHLLCFSDPSLTYSIPLPSQSVWFNLPYNVRRPSTVAVPLMHEMSSLARTLGSWVRIPPKAWMSVCVYSVFVLGSGLVRGWSPSKESYQLS